MALKRFWGKGIGVGGWVSLDRDSLKHARVSRMRPGEIIELLDGEGNFWRGKFENDGVTVSEAGQAEKQRPEIILAVGVTQGGTMEDIMRQATELGVSEIWPVQTKNAAPELEPTRAENKHERWERIAEEACKQSGLYWRSRIGRVEDFAVVLAKSAGAQNIVAAMGDAVTPWEKIAWNGERIVVWVGPEGGFAAEEMEKLATAGAVCVSLGATTLRVETACVATLSLVAQRARGS